MLKLRIASSAIALILLTAIVFFGQIALGTAVFVLALLGLYEFYNAVSAKGAKPIRIVGYLMCLPLIFMGFDGYFKIVNDFEKLLFVIGICFLFIFICIVWLFTNLIFMHKKYNLNDAALTILGVFYVVFLFCFIPLTRNLNHGHIHIWMVFIGAFATDTAAYFVGKFVAGRFIGRHMLLPEVSPKKTVEGAIGGIIGSILTMTLYGFLVNKYFIAFPIYHFVILGLLTGFVSQIGDWSASAIKRYVDVKDYGSVMPGHGGVLDRVDSVLFVAPLVFFYVSFFMQ